MHVVVEQGAELGPHSKLGHGVMIYAGARIGSHFTAKAHAVIRGCARIGNRVTVHEGAVVGEDAFCYARQRDGGWLLLRGPGIVIVEDDVEIFPHAVIERDPVGATLICRGVTIGPHSEVGHGSSVGPQSVLCGQVGLAGSTQLGSGVWAGRQAGLAGHLKVGRGAVLLEQTGVCGDLEGGRVYAGMPAIEAELYRAAGDALREIIALKHGGPRVASD